MAYPGGSESGRPKGLREVKVLDLAILLVNVWKAAQHKAVGFEDADKALDRLVVTLGGHRPVEITQADLESCLWSCNLIDERGKFWHPQGAEFDTFTQRFLAGGEKFDKDYNYIKESKE